MKICSTESETLLRIMLRKERTEYGKKIRKDYEAHRIYEKRANMTEYNFRPDGLCNTISTVQKDCMLCVIKKGGTGGK